MELTTTHRRMLLVSGVGYAVMLAALVLVAVLAPLHTTLDGLSAAEVSAEYAAAPDGFVTENLMGLLALSVLLVFASALSGALGAIGGADALARLALASVVVMVTIAFLVNGLQLGAVAGAALGIDPQVLRALDELGLVLGAVSSIPTATFLAAGSLGVLRTGIAARWTGWLGLFCALTFGVGIFTLYGEDGLAGAIWAFGAPLHLVWIAAVGVSAFRGPRGARSAAVPAGAEA